MTTSLDPVRYEMFRHRLWNILEQGRLSMQLVSGSPVVVEGGECMSSFYDANGTVILTACGLLLHCTGCQEAIQRCVEWYEETPGIYEEDQFFFNDPYIAATHVYDMLVIKPIFYQGRRIAWAGAMMHTADTGGVLRGGASEIFHEGIRFPGIKIVDRGELRLDVFKAITEQCRDPHYVGLDLNAKIAANNVCAKAFLELVDKYGIAFVEAASQKIIADSAAMARAKLRRLPDGTWRSRLYAFAHDRGLPKPFKVLCTMTKEGDEITFDYTGTSPQNQDAGNATYFCAWSGLFVVLAGHLFWDVPWNGGMVAPVRLEVPQGTLLNCTFPAACGRGPATVSIMTAAAHDCIDKMLYAGGFLEDINALWRSGGGGAGSNGGERGRYGGHNQHGGVVAQQIYDFFAGGLGATPLRDGVHSGANMINAQSLISDVELVEMNYPLLYLCRNHLRDSGGFGKFRGGMGVERIMMVYGSQDFSENYGHNRGIPGGRGLFGGYSAGIPHTVIYRTEGLPEVLRQGRYPASTEELGPEWGELIDPRRPFGRMPLGEYWLLADYGVSVGGSGYGDPLDRPIEQVLADIRNQIVSPHNAERMYGVVLQPESLALDAARTEERRRQLQEERLQEGKPIG